MDTHSAVHNLMQAQLGHAASMISGTAGLSGLGDLTISTGSGGSAGSSGGGSTSTTTTSTTSALSTRTLVVNTCNMLKQQIADATAKLKASLTTVQQQIAMPYTKPSASSLSALLHATRALGDLEGQYVACTTSTNRTIDQLKDAIKGYTAALVSSESAATQAILDRNYERWFMAREAVQKVRRDISTTASWLRQAELIAKQSAEAAAKAEAEAAARAAEEAQKAAADAAEKTANVEVVATDVTTSPTPVSLWAQHKKLLIGAGLVAILGAGGVIWWRSRQG